MTNKEWLTTLSSKDLANVLGDPCRMCYYQDLDDKCQDKNCISGILMWLNRERVEPKKELTPSQLITEFEYQFADRRALSMDEVKKCINRIFDPIGGKHGEV